MISNQKFILASKSPRRREILKKMNLNFIVEKINVNEYNNIIDPIKKTIYVSKLKSNSYNKKIYKNTILITADTLVHEKIILQKPKNEQESIDMLKYLSNKKHYVTTGVTLKTCKKQISFHATTEVYFNKINLKEIMFYINNFKTKDKAGSYGIQDWIGLIGVKKIHGCFYNIMGFPANKLYQNIKFFKD